MDREAVDPIGVALSITAGKRSAPADRNPAQLRPHRGRTSCRGRAGAGMRCLGPWRMTASRCPRVCLRLTRGKGKLDPYGVPLLGGSFPRVRLWLTRGYQRFDPYGVAGLAVWLWGAVGSPCGRLRCIFAGVGPLWGPHIYASSFRGRASLTRGYRIVRPPMGALASRRGFCPRVIFCRMGICLRRDAIHRVSPARGTAPP